MTRSVAVPGAPKADALARGVESDADTRVPGQRRRNTALCVPGVPGAGTSSASLWSGRAGQEPTTGEKETRGGGGGGRAAGTNHGPAGAPSEAAPGGQPCGHRRTDGGYWGAAPDHVGAFTKPGVSRAAPSGPHLWGQKSPRIGEVPRGLASEGTEDTVPREPADRRWRRRPHGFEGDTLETRGWFDPPSGHPATSTRSPWRRGRVETAVAGGEPEWRRKNEKQACRWLDGAGGCSGSVSPGPRATPAEKGSLL